MLQSVASLIDDARVIIYICNMFKIQATGECATKLHAWGWGKIRYTVFNWHILKLGFHLIGFSKNESFQIWFIFARANELIVDTIESVKLDTSQELKNNNNRLLKHHWGRKWMEGRLDFNLQRLNLVKNVPVRQEEGTLTKGEGSVQLVSSPR